MMRSHLIRHGIYTYDYNRQDVVLTLRPDQVEELRDLLNDMLNKGEHHGADE
jgi:hypothetical protein